VKMGRTIREVAKRHIEQAQGLLDNTGKHLAWVESTYRQAHPEISDQVLIALQVTAGLIEYLDSLTSTF